MSFQIVDPVRNRQASMASYMTREQAEDQITRWQYRHDKGGRPDISREFLLRIRVVENFREQSNV